jgi:hypothetical protein
MSEEKYNVVIYQNHGLVSAVFLIYFDATVHAGKKSIPVFDIINRH